MSTSEPAPNPPQQAQPLPRNQTPRDKALSGSALYFLAVVVILFGVILPVAVGLFQANERARTLNELEQPLQEIKAKVNRMPLQANKTLREETVHKKTKSDRELDRTRTP